jgi:transposase InsO family protein
MGVSERFACRVTGQNRTTQRRPPASTTTADPDAALRAWLRAWAKDHPRRGFRNAYHDARAEGRTVNHKKIQRLWREEGLRVPQRRRRKRLGTTTTQTLPVADAPNRVWAVDFQFDATTDARPIQIASIVDEHTRECLGGLVARSITAAALIAELDRLSQQRGYPTVLRCDNGPELACAAMADWASERIGLHFIPPGEPWRNGYVESLNARMRDEFLYINIFWSSRRPESSSATGRPTTTTDAGTAHSATYSQRSTLLTAPTDEDRLSREVDQFSGSGHRSCRVISRRQPGERG